jgi:hypothetical protein
MCNGPSNSLGRLAASLSKTPAVRGPPPMKAIAGTRDGMGSPE